MPKEFFFYELAIRSEVYLVCTHKDTSHIRFTRHYVAVIPGTSRPRRRRAGARRRARCRRGDESATMRQSEGVSPRGAASRASRALGNPAASGL